MEFRFFCFFYSMGSSDDNLTCKLQCCKSKLSLKIIFNSFVLLDSIQFNSIQSDFIMRNDWRHNRCLSSKLSVDFREMKSHKQALLSTLIGIRRDWLLVIIFDLIRRYKSGVLAIYKLSLEQINSTWLNVCVFNCESNNLLL